MVKLILGPKGSGKTKWLIDGANKDKANGNGNIVFIDTDDSHIFTLDHGVRLVNARKFEIGCESCFYGFLTGIIARDFDIEKIYIDGIYEVLDFKDDSLEKLLDKLEKIGNEYNVEFLIGLNKLTNEIPEKYRSNSIELEI